LEGEGKEDMEEGLPPELADNMASLSEAVERIKKHVQSLLQSPMDTLLEQMDGIDYAKLNTLIAYSLTTLFYGTFSAILVFKPHCLSVYLKSRGVSPSEHPIKEELVRAIYLKFCLIVKYLQERIKLYFQKVKDLDKKIPGMFLTLYVELIC